MYVRKYVPTYVRVYVCALVRGRRNRDGEDQQVYIQLRTGRECVTVG